MSRPQISSSFALPSTAPSASTAPKAPREPKPYATVPAPLATDEREALEPHWHPAIDAATD